MQLIAASLSGRVYCDSSVVASDVTLSSTEPYAKNAGQPLPQPCASAWRVGVVAPASCVTSSHAFVAVEPVKLGNIAPMFFCAMPSGPSGTKTSLPIWLPVLPSNSCTRSVVVENCDAFTKPTLPRYVPASGVPVLLRRPVMNTLSRPAAAPSDDA